MKFKFIVLVLVVTLWGFRGSSAGKKSACSSGDPGSIPGSGRFPWRRDRLPNPVFLNFPGGSDGKESACNAGNLGLIPGLPTGIFAFDSENHGPKSKGNFGLHTHLSPIYH